MQAEKSGATGGHDHVSAHVTRERCDGETNSHMLTSLAHTAKKAAPTEKEQLIRRPAFFSFRTIDNCHHVRTTR